MLLDGSVATAALAAQAVSTTRPTNAVDTGDAALARIFPTGIHGTPADKDFGYDVTLWYPVDVPDKTPTFMPIIVAAGIATNGTTACPTAANCNFADTITETAKTGCVVHSPANNSVAWIDVPIRNARYIQLRVDIDGGSAAVTSVDALVQFGEDISSMAMLDADVDLGDMDWVAAGLAATSIGATDAAVVDAGAVGSLSAKMRRLTTDLDALITVMKDSDAGSLGAGNILGDILAKITASASTSANQIVLTSAPVEKTPVAVSQFIATPSTAEALVGSETFARVLHLQAKRAAADNSGNVFVGLTGLDSGAAEMFELEPGAVFSFEMPAGTKIDLNDVYIDSITATDGVVGWYVPV